MEQTHLVIHKQKKTIGSNIWSAAKKDRPPYISGFYFDSYDIRKNRCCREVGKEITMYTYSEDNETGDSEENNLTAYLDETN